MRRRSHRSFRRRGRAGYRRGRVPSRRRSRTMSTFMPMRMRLGLRK